MKRQILSLVAGALLLGAPMIAQGVQARQPGEGNRMERMVKELNLTDAQQAQLKQMHESHHAEMQAVFTSEQKALLKAAKEGKKGDRREVMKSLNLSDSQKAQIKAIRDRQRQDFESILTPEQKQKLAQKKTEMKARWQQKQGSKSGV